MIPSYATIKWISDPVELKVEGNGDHYEHFVLFHNIASSNLENPLRVILRFNHTELNLEFQIENSRAFIDIADSQKFESETNRKGQLRLYDIEKDDMTADWSEKFSLDVIKSTGMIACQVPNDRTYTVCVDIITSSFGLTKIVTLSPSIVIINKSIIAIVIAETVPDKEQDKWIPVNPEQFLFGLNTKDGLMLVRYTHNRVTSSPFMINQRHRTLLCMNYEEHPAIYVEVTTTGLDGIRVIFEDYKINDAPPLAV